MKKIVTARKFRRTSAEKLRDRAKIAEYHLKGLSSYKIAGELATTNPYRLDPSTIRNDIAAIEDQWRETVATSLERLKATQAERIKKAMHEAWNAWEKSKTPQQERTTVGIPNSQGEGPALKETRVMTKESNGDVVYLHAVMNCIEELNKLFGLHGDHRGTSGMLAGGSISIESFGIDPAHAHRVLLEEFLWALVNGEYANHPMLVTAGVRIIRPAPAPAAGRQGEGGT